MTRNEFRALLPPPLKPQLPPVNWSAVRQHLGAELPSDYQWFIDTYGAGNFGDWRIAHPDYPEGGVTLWALIESPE